eukprot:sb/3466250/
MAAVLSYPKQGLQPFTKVFGEPLYEVKPEQEPTQTRKRRKTDEETKDEKPQFIDDGFDYSDDSDEEAEDFSDIIPENAPEDTINTLKTLSAHVRTSEKRKFTKLERQLLSTVVQHGIITGGAQSAPPQPSSAPEESTKPQPAKPRQVEPTSSSAPPPQQAHTSRQRQPSDISSGSPVDEPFDQDLPVPLSRRALLSAPERSILLNRPILPQRTQKVMQKLRQKAHFYHPDDEPAVQLLEDMARSSNRGNEESIFDNAITSFYKRKRLPSPPGPRPLPTSTRPSRKRRPRRPEVHFQRPSFGRGVDRGRFKWSREFTDKMESARKVVLRLKEETHQDNEKPGEAEEGEL